MIAKRRTIGGKSRPGDVSAPEVATPPQGQDVPTAVSLSVGAPLWITRELIADTIDTWQPYYAQTLTCKDALKILLNVGNMIDVLGEPA